MRQITPPVEDYAVNEAPFYVPVAGEEALFEQAWSVQIPVLLMP